MALYQPSNITPSTFAGIGGGVIDAADNVSVSWQVNGTSAMTGFSIAVYQNNSSSTLVHTFTVTLSTPFYGTDAEGNPVFYVYEPGSTWSSNGLSNGNSYKLKITQNWMEGGSSKSVVQTSESVFITRAKPTLSVSPASGTLTSVAQTFTGTYAQTQGDAISWVRWVLSDTDGNVLDDTGTIYTGLLSYSYDGFFTGNTYVLSCTACSSSGVEVNAVNVYAVSYDTAEQTGGISLSCHPDDSVTVAWAAGADIPGVPSAPNYGTISGGVLHLAAERSITWSQVNGENMAFPSPYCFAWKGRIAKSGTVTETVSSGTWTLDKTYTDTRTRDESHTMSTSAWTKNPNASDKGKRTITVPIVVTTPVESRSTLYPTSRVTLDRLSTGEAYTYSNSIPSTFTCNYDIIIYRNGTAYYDTGSTWSVLPDSLVDVTLLSDNRTLSVTIYTNYDAAYMKTVYANFDVEYAEYYKGETLANPGPSDTGISSPVIVEQDTALYQTSISYSSSSNQFTIKARSLTSGTYQITYQYTYTTTPNNLYVAKWGGSTGLNLTSARVISTTASGGATVQVNKNTSGQTVNGNYAVTEYNSSKAQTQTTVRLTYTVQITGSDSYKTVVTGWKQGAVSASIQSTTATRASVTLGANGQYTVTMYYSSSSSTRTAVVAFETPVYFETGKLVSASDGTNEAYISIEERSGGRYGILLSIGGTEIDFASIPTGAWRVLVIVRPNDAQYLFWDASDTLMLNDRQAVFYEPLPNPVSSVTAEGEQYCEYIFVSQNPNYDFAAAGYDPAWDRETLFYAAFDSDLQAGTVGADDSLAVAIYRREGDALSPVGIFGTEVHSVRDYGIRSGHEYLYELFYISEGKYSAGAESASICKRFRQHTLIEAEEDAQLHNVYHPVRVWRFRDNVDAGAYTNQNQPVLLDNFTKYPLWQPSSPRARAGTLVALLGRFVNGVYSGETTEDMDRLFALSASTNPLFYRDMKGNLYMVRLSGPITQTINNQTGALEVSVSVPWVETGDADGAKIYTVEE